MMTRECVNIWGDTTLENEFTATMRFDTFHQDRSMMEYFELPKLLFRVFTR
jgi:hypothetical protein